MDLVSLTHDLGIRWAGEPVGVRVCDVTDDSRTVVPGSLFIARAGARHDGRAHIDDAVRAGAVAVLTDRAPERPPAKCALLLADDVPLAAARVGERFFGEPSRRLMLVGVTGTNGKTTTSHLIYDLLNRAGVRCGLIGTVIIDDGVEIAPATLTTPASLEISRTLSMMVESGCRACVMEVSSHALTQNRVAGLHVDVGVYTNLTGDHLDYHESLEHYADAKAALFAMLEPSGVAVVNAEDPGTSTMAPLSCCRVWASAWRYTSVLPLPVTPWSRKVRGTGWRPVAAPDSSRAHRTGFKADCCSGFNGRGCVGRMCSCA
jgi:UDP-N-acetylmuramoyl-L-alanyl-D-glutamate--2,6-diaminopimelate ligase